MVSTALPVYCPLLKRIQLTFTVWLLSLNTRDNDRGKTNRSCQKHLFILLHDTVILFTTNLKSNLCTPLNKRGTADNNSTASYAQNTTALQPTVFFCWHTSVTGRKHRSVSFPQHKQSPRSTANSSFSMSTSTTTFSRYLH